MVGVTFLWLKDIQGLTTYLLRSSGAAWRSAKRHGSMWDNCNTSFPTQAVFFSTPHCYQAAALWHNRSGDLCFVDRFTLVVGCNTTPTTAAPTGLLQGADLGFSEF